MTEPHSAQTEGAPSHIILLGRYYSDCTSRIRLALNLKGLDYEYIAADPTQGESLPTWPNLSGTIPTLLIQHPQDRGNSLGQPKPITTQTITQSVAAIEYLEEMYPTQTPLMPPHSQPAARALVRTLVNIIASDIHPLTTSRTGRRIAEQFPGPETEVVIKTGNRQWEAFWIRRGLEAYEKTIIGVAGRYSVGDDITLADVCLMPQLWTARKMHVYFDEFPTIKGVFERLSDVDAFHRAHWRRQIDTPEELQAPDVRLQRGKGS